MNEPLKTALFALARSRIEEKYKQMDAATWDLLACSADPDYRPERARLLIHDSPYYPYDGFCFPEYAGERVGPVRTWPAAGEGGRAN
jgi:hypothetical protein